ncbi:MAG TPA: helix-turn-helix domain-containing protein [Myxococcota bacterium]|nr:helix-turn-helix domain-containing protein [Myxococcota bacterium]
MSTLCFGGRHMVGRRSEKELLIVAAAFERFARYGFRRTSLGDIAREAGISRPAVYLHFPNKQAIFRVAASVMHERALRAASKAALASGGIEARIAQILAAKLGSFFEIAHGSAHVGEILDENSRLCGDISEAARRRYLRILRGVIEDAARRGELAPAAAGLTTAAAAELIVDSAKGLETAGAAKLTPLAYRRRVAQLVNVLVRGMGGRSRARTPARSRTESAPRARAAARRA